MQVVTQADAKITKLQRCASPGSWRLARNPLLLTVMAILHSKQNELPDACFPAL
ncbi:MAG: hypothetical protein R3A10_02800 [Caldilineaceae bacterium]